MSSSATSVPPTVGLSLVGSAGFMAPDAAALPRSQSGRLSPNGVQYATDTSARHHMPGALAAATATRQRVTPHGGGGGGVSASPVRGSRGPSHGQQHQRSNHPRSSSGGSGGLAVPSSPASHVSLGGDGDSDAAGEGGGGDDDDGAGSAFAVAAASTQEPLPTSLPALLVGETQAAVAAPVSNAMHVCTVAGNGSSGHVDGVAGHCQLDYPVDVALATDGTLFVAEVGSNVVRAALLSPDHHHLAASAAQPAGTPAAATASVQLVTAVGAPGSGSAANGDATTARFAYPCGVAVYTPTLGVAASTKAASRKRRRQSTALHRSRISATPSLDRHGDRLVIVDCLNAAVRCYDCRTGTVSTLLQGVHRSNNTHGTNGSSSSRRPQQSPGKHRRNHKARSRPRTGTWESNQVGWSRVEAAVTATLTCSTSLQFREPRGCTVSSVNGMAYVTDRAGIFGINLESHAVRLVTGGAWGRDNHGR